VTSNPRPRLLLLAMYPLDAPARSGPTVRIQRLGAALRDRVSLDVVDGHRAERRWKILRYLLSGRLRSVAGVYVESSTALPSEMDLALLGLARVLGLPVLTYVRDAYQLFPDYYPAGTFRTRLSRRLFPAAIGALRLVSSRLAFPSRGLATAVLGPNATFLLLPPGAPEPLHVPREPDARSLLFVGDLRVPAQGGETLIGAVERARADGAVVELVCVTRPGGEPPAPHPAWLRIERAGADDVARLLPDVVATVIPRAPGAYNDLAIPIKLMEYLALGRPILTTDRTEAAAIVREADAGIVVDDGAEALASGILRVLAAPEERRAAWELGARAAAERHSWHRTADAVLRALGLDVAARVAT
jgi:glycosyltransferase involved in cell wall biosynthesis